MDALNHQRNRDGNEKINKAHCEVPIIVTITIAPGCARSRFHG